MADEVGPSRGGETGMGGGASGSAAAGKGDGAFVGSWGGRPVAVVTGASSGIGYELARVCALNGYDLVVAADNPEIKDCGQRIARLGVNVRAVEADLATEKGVDQLHDATKELKLPVDILCANAGRGLGHDFLGQDWKEIRDVIDTNIIGTVYLLRKFLPDMCLRRKGRILITGSIAGFIPGTYQAVYNGTKAFIDSFAYALRHELKKKGITVTCLMPGATETEFFRRAGMMDTRAGQRKKDDALKVAIAGFNAMMRGKGSVVPGLKNKLQAAAGGILPQGLTAELHRIQAQPQ
ncbi:MAG TPA: SDR family NAD(P)-dependent oxidoreductase [Hyphomicrobiales bacterium]|nr:SDR family NAD(P)-dependent oxidoreductase [Hyphomicrobiales bacterium]